MSVFLAVDLDEVVRALVAQRVETARTALAAKWLQAEKYHLTLVFLGNATPVQVAQFEPLLHALVTRHESFRLHLRGAGTFVTQRAPAVLWLGVDGELASLAALQRDAASTLGSPERAWAPHVTLARAPRAGAFDELRAALADFTTPAFEVRHVTLYESTHHQYQVLHRFDFARRFERP